MIGPGGHLPGLGPHDPRVPVDVSVWPWSAIVLVQVAGVARCSGFLLNSHTIMTAAHCLYLPQLRHMAPPEAIHVLSGYRRGAYTGHTVSVGYRIAPGWDMLDHDKGRGADAAVVMLASALPGGALGLFPDHAGQAAMLGGYEQDRSQVLIADTDCRLMGLVTTSGGSLRQDSCAATSGTSGAPVLARDGNGIWAVAGLQVAAVKGEAGGLAVPEPTLAALIASK